MGVLDKYSCEGQMNIFDFLKPEIPDIPINTEQCEGCRFRNEGRYEVDKKSGYTWKYGCPGTASANWPSGTPMNVSEPLLMPDGCYYENNIVDGVMHIHCWNNDSDRRFINKYTALREIEEALDLEFKYNTHFSEWECDIKKLHIKLSVNFSTAEYSNANTKEGDDVILIGYDVGKVGGGVPCDSIEEAIRRLKKYIDDNKKPICKFSHHSCNKEALWEVADDMRLEGDDIECPHKCCRECNQPGCGSRCNGSDEPKICDENCSECKKYESERMSFDGKRITYSCAVASKTVVKNIPCGRTCDVEWCSRTCFERRGYQWDYHDRGWLKGSDGKALISSVKECDWEPHNKESEYDVKFEDFKEHCTHNGWIKGEEDADGNNHSVTMCSYANGKKATCWSDWIPCTEENCEIVRKVKSNVKNSD